MNEIPPNPLYERGEFVETTSKPSPFGEGLRLGEEIEGDFAAPSSSLKRRIVILSMSKGSE